MGPSRHRYSYRQPSRYADIRFDGFECRFDLPSAIMSMPESQNLQKRPRLLCFLVLRVVPKNGFGFTLQKVMTTGSCPRGHVTNHLWRMRLENKAHLFG